MCYNICVIIKMNIHIWMLYVCTRMCMYNGRLLWNSCFFVFRFSFSFSYFLSDLIVFTQQLSCCWNIYCQATHLSITELSSLSFTLCLPYPSYSLWFSDIRWERKLLNVLSSVLCLSIILCFFVKSLFSLSLLPASLLLSRSLVCYLLLSHVLVSPTKYVKGNWQSLSANVFECRRSSASFVFDRKCGF